MQMTLRRGRGENNGAEASITPGRGGPGPRIRCSGVGRHTGPEDTGAWLFEVMLDDFRLDSNLDTQVSWNFMFNMKTSF